MTGNDAGIMGSPLIGYIGILIVFGTIIVIHELGHFIAAKLSGMAVHEFSIGFGPALFSRIMRGTRYSLRLLPLGGYVRIAGMEPGEEEEPNGFYSKPFISKFITILAGVTMNIILALMIFIIMGMAIGRPKPVIHEVKPNTPAAQAGIKANDRIIQVANVENPDIGEAVNLISSSRPPVKVIVLRGQQRLSFSLTPVMLKDEDGRENKRIGVALEATYKKVGVSESVTKGFVDTYDATRVMIMGIGMLFTGHAPPGSVSGAVGISRIIYQAASQSLLSPENLSWFLLIFALISLNIAIINLLPIPALDGSHLVILAIERIRGKEFNPEKKALIHTIGFVLLISLILIITGHDIWNWIKGAPPIPGR